MKQVIERIEQIGEGDPVIFSWINMRRRGKLSDEESVIHLVKALINSKNMAVRVLDKFKQDSKVIKFRK